MSDDAATFDHLIHWVDDLDAAMAAYDAAGLPTRPALTMPGFRNAAWGIDDERYVELATVDDWDAVATSKYAAGLELLRPAVEDVEVYFEEQQAGFVEVFVRDVPAYFPFFITYDPPRAEIARMRAEHRATEGITFDGSPDLVALLVRSPEPEADARLLADLVGCPARGATVALPGPRCASRRAPRPACTASRSAASTRRAGRPRWPA